MGITPVDNFGFVIDAWGGRVRYAVTNSNGNAFTTNGTMQSTGITNLTPNLMICADSACGTVLSSNAVAVIYSLGKNPTVNGGSDETQNNPVSPGDGVFVSHEFRNAGAGGEFDHIVTWLSPNILYNRMIAAGRLP